MLGAPPPDIRLPPDLSSGGVVALILGRGDDVPVDYGYHPRVVPIEANKLTLRDIDNRIPGNTRVAVFCPGWIHADLYQALHAVLKRRRLPYVNCEGMHPDMMRQRLAQLLPKPTVSNGGERTFMEPIPVTTNGAPPEPKRGSVKQFVEQHLPALLAEDATMPKAEAGRRLFVIAEREGLQTTVGSLAQAVYAMKRDTNRGERPVSAQPPATKVRVALAHALMALEAATEHVKSVQVEYERVLAENARLRQHQAKAAEVFKVFQRDVLGDNQGDD